MSNARIEFERATTAHFATLNRAATNARIGMKRAFERDQHERYQFIFDGGYAETYDRIKRRAVLDGVWNTRIDVYALIEAYDIIDAGPDYPAS